MKSTFLTTWIFLMLFTLVTAFMANSGFEYAALAILGLALLKCIGVAFYFMELKKANPFWKVSLLSFLIIFFTIILLV
ncbi:cytochrome c oxidase subunit IV [Arenibacter algicola]|uniref:Cytochrome c oxidase subunit IV n=1 Tax=Arenibacter algicola TaxID=616991 RepID=A0A221UV82_9FLAO|nr:cytochrome C oxidase subunit IV family protein [Arenibacter algicola]ASO05299.1 prokaryotic cytochrome C oxidase subunit IV [Arenibacter algicola]|tara:strand:+ start:2644 stop:2877 length:234 start_codon:yes stop_codon:yes gene_type:complete